VSVNKISPYGTVVTERNNLSRITKDRQFK